MREYLDQHTSESRSNSLLNTCIDSCSTALLQSVIAKLVGELKKRYQSYLKVDNIFGFLTKLNKMDFDEMISLFLQK